MLVTVIQNIDLWLSYSNCLMAQLQLHQCFKVGNFKTKQYFKIKIQSIDLSHEMSLTQSI